MIGSTVECAAWFNPNTKDAQARTAKGLVLAMRSKAESSGLIYDEYRWQVFAPGSDDRVPDPHRDAPNGVLLLHCEADVIAMEPQATRFTDELSDHDLTKLRASARTVANRHRSSLSDEECDDLINDLGPSIFEQVLNGVADN